MNTRSPRVEQRRVQPRLARAANLVALAPLLACTKSPTMRERSHDVLASPPQPTAAFVVYLDDGGIVSLVLPVVASSDTSGNIPDEGAEFHQLPGLLTQTIAGSGNDVRRSVARGVSTGALDVQGPDGLEALWAFRCRSAAEAVGACGVTGETVVTVETEFSHGDGGEVASIATQRLWLGGPALRSDDPCTCIHLPYLDRETFIDHGLDVSEDPPASVDAVDDEEESDDDQGSDDGECEDECGDDECTFVTLASVFGGRVQAVAETANLSCGNRYITADVDVWKSSGDPLPAFSTWAGGVAFVEAARIDGNGADVPWPLPIEDLPALPVGEQRLTPSPAGDSADGDGGEGGESDDSGEGDDWSEPTCSPLDGEIYSLHRGLVIRSTVGLDQWVSCTWHDVAVASPTTCPTPADPCGDATLFPSLAHAEDTDDFWVASDGSAALLWTKPPRLLRRSSGVGARGGPRGTAIETIAVAPRGQPDHRPDDPVLGVHHYADAEPIRAAIAASLPEGDRACSWLPWPLALTTPASRAPQASAASPPDSAAVVDHGDGKGWGNHCFREFKAGHHDDAFAACEHALTLATSATTRAAIFHSLGLIAVAKGNRPAAVAYFRTSLELRDNDATRAAFQAALAEHLESQR